MKLLMALLVLVIWSSACFAHETQILNCEPRYQKVKKINEEVLPNGLLVERYDTNGDGKPDVNTMSVITGADDKELQHQGLPTFYIIDRAPYDGYADYMMVDQTGDGICESIVLYLDFDKEQPVPLGGKVAQ